MSTTGRLGFKGHKGMNKIVFQGRLAHKRFLAPGRYVLFIGATNGEGSRAERKVLRFTIAEAVGGQATGRRR
jgi:hypothetical protein